MSPPPDTSHVTKQSLGEFCDSHAMFADTNEFSRTIDVTPSDHVASMDLLMLVDTVQSSQHCNKEIENILVTKFFGLEIKLLIFMANYDRLSSVSFHKHIKWIYEIQFNSM